MTALAGTRVAVLEGRAAEELAVLVRRHGGAPLLAPAVRDERLHAAPAVAALLDRFRDGPAPCVVLSTGVGVAALFAEARVLGAEPALRALLGRATLVARGPKPVAALHREGLAAEVRVPEPYTTEELLRALAPLDLGGRAVCVVHYGEPNLPLVDALRGRGAAVHELLLYAWRLPDDVRPLQRLVGELVAGRVGAVVFTSQVQVRHLFQVAAERGSADALREALRARTVVAAIGPTCAAALERVGVPPHVVPARPKMAPLVAALADHVARSRGG